ncbi:MAG: ROK family protein [Coriobacteriia bacterium]|nr:ROK family protein [Coriobacteriia bacterium]
MIETDQAFGIDIGGSGIKGAPVNLETGEFAQERLRIPTPQESTPEAVAGVVREILDAFEVADGTPVGIAFPAPVHVGRPLHFMGNLDQSWLGVDINQFMSESTGRRVHVVNDGDAAGLGEALYGSARNVGGLVIATTLGTGIGTALIMDGILIPNTELGHIILDGTDAEKLAADSARTREELSWKKWGARLTKYYRALEHYLAPEIFVVGGGVSKKHEKFFPYIDINTPIVPAALLNTAGIVGAAAYAHKMEALATRA